MFFLRLHTVMSPPLFAGANALARNAAGTRCVCEFRDSRVRVNSAAGNKKNQVEVQIKSEEPDGVTARCVRVRERHMWNCFKHARQDGGLEF